MSQIDLQAEDQASLLSVKSIQPSPDTLSSMFSRLAISRLMRFMVLNFLFYPLELVKRLRTMTLTLLPIEVPLDSLNDPTSRTITPQVISAYMAAAGDFMEAVCYRTICTTLGTHVYAQLPYCLLRARKEFMWDANHNPADYGENLCRGEDLVQRW